METKKQTPLANVNGKEIYASDIDNVIAQLPPEQQMQFTTREARRALLDELIAQDLLYFEALDEGLEESEQFQEILQDAKQKLLATTALANFMQAVTIEDDAAKEYYEAHPEEFIAPESMRASHILVPDKLQAEAILRDIKNGDKDFEAAARELSVCPSAPRGGDLGYFGQGQMVPEFDQAVQELEVGEMTEEPVQTQFGYHIIKKTDHKKDETIPFDLIKDQLGTYLLALEQDKKFKEHVDSLKDKYPVELNLGLI